jgi:hypothetical protein
MRCGRGWKKGEILIDFAAENEGGADRAAERQVAGGPGAPEIGMALKSHLALIL